MELFHRTTYNYIQITENCINYLASSPKSAQYHASTLALVIEACLLSIFCIQGEFMISRVMYDRQIDLSVIS